MLLLGQNVLIVVRHVVDQVRRVQVDEVPPPGEAAECRGGVLAEGRVFVQQVVTSCRDWAFLLDLSTGPAATAATFSVR